MTSANPPKENDTEVRLRLRLYVAGESPNSVAALANLQRALQQHAANRVDLEVIDIVDDPERSVRDGVLVTPMLVKLEPLPERRLLGSLKDQAVLVEALGLERCAS